MQRKCKYQKMKQLIRCNCLDIVFFISNYGDGTVINVQDCGDEVSTVLTTVIQNISDKTPQFLRLGMYTSKPRGLKHHIKGQSLSSSKEEEDHSLEVTV